ncbi:MAG: TrmH family RNA methyltransferase [Solirubrobacteraceae bacterium]
MAHITSNSNARLKALKRLGTRRERARSGLFAAEGEDLVLAAARAQRPTVEGFRLTGSGAGYDGFHDVDEVPLRAVSVLGSGTRVIGVYEQRWGKPVGPLCVYLHGVSDPGNIGTIVRSAHAFGASCVALGPGCADPHSPKAVRASMGAIFDVSLARVGDVGELPGERLALLAGAEQELRSAQAAKTQGPLSLLIGAEREGLPEPVVAACESSARIAICGESLNAAMAATVALYEVTRGRRRASGSSRVRS